MPITSNFQEGNYYSTINDHDREYSNKRGTRDARDGNVSSDCKIETIQEPSKKSSVVMVKDLESLRTVTKSVTFTEKWTYTNLQDCATPNVDGYIPYYSRKPEARSQLTNTL